MKIGTTVVDKKQFWSPCVYTALKDGKALYIGMSSIGYARVFFNRSKSEEGRTKAFAECDQVSIDFFETKEDALEAEEKAIHEHHPPYNVDCLQCCKDRGPELLERKDELKKFYLHVAQDLIREFGFIPPYRIVKERGLRSFYNYVARRPDLF